MYFVKRVLEITDLIVSEEEEIIWAEKGPQLDVEAQGGNSSSK